MRGKGSALALSLSICAHGVLFFLVAWYFNRPPDAEPIERWVEVAPLPPSSQPPNASGSGGVRHSKPAGNTLGLKDLGLDWQAGNTLGIPQPDSDTKDSSPEYARSPLKDGYDTGQILAAVQHSVTYQFLYEKIDDALYFPSEFEENDIEGIVRAWVFFSADGVFQKNKSRFQSGNRFLRVFVIRLLKETFDEAIPANFVPKHREFEIPCTFYFEITRRDNPMDNSRTAMAKSPKTGWVGVNFSFYRSKRVVGQWKVGPFSGYGIVPSVGVDPSWFVDQVTGVVSKKAVVDPLERYRRDPDF